MRADHSSRAVRVFPGSVPSFIPAGHPVNDGGCGLDQTQGSTPISRLWGLSFLQLSLRLFLEALSSTGFTFIVNFDSSCLRCWDLESLCLDLFLQLTDRLPVACACSWKEVAPPVKLHTRLDPMTGAPWAPATWSRTAPRPPSGHVPSVCVLSSPPSGGSRCRHRASGCLRALTGGDPCR